MEGFYPMPVRPGASPEEQFAAASRHIDRCLLCGGALAYMAVFVVTKDPEKFLPVKIKPGKARVLFYGLCDPCFGLPDKAQLVEDHFERKAREACA